MYRYVNFLNSLEAEFQAEEKLQSDNELSATCSIIYLHYTELQNTTLNTSFPLLPLFFPPFQFTIVITCHETLRNSTYSRYIVFLNKHLSSYSLARNWHILVLPVLVSSLSLVVCKVWLQYPRPESATSFYQHRVFLKSES